MRNTNFVKSNVSDMPSWAKGIIGIALLGGIAIVSYKVYKKIKQIELLKGSKQENNEASKELDKVIASGGKLSYPTSQYSTYANIIWSAMDGYGTDTDAVMRVFANLKTNADFLALNKAFGVRTISSGAFNPSSDYKGSLSGAMVSELPNYKLRDINTSMSKKGITYKF